jgi:hypothetical protein
MSPEQSATAAALARLLGEIRDDRDAMARRGRDLEDAMARLGQTPRDAAALALEAWALHGWYTALETLIERIARQLDAEVPGGDRWRRELLAQCCVEVPGVRPAVLPRELRGDLEALLALRHFLRHAYGTDLDAQRLHVEAERLGVVAPMSGMGAWMIRQFMRRAPVRSQLPHLLLCSRTAMLGIATRSRRQISARRRGR